MKNTKLAILFYLFLYALMFFFTLNFNYVEGDDAATILYHLCGQNAEIQRPYAAYNSGMDFVLQHSGLHSEQALRIFAISFSFVSGLLVLVLSILMLEKLFEKSKIVSAKTRLYFYLALPFLIPDMLFHSLIVNASNISFVFLLVSLICYIRFLKRGHNKDLILAMVMFAVSVPFRWTMLIALPLYAGFFVYFHPIRNYPKQIWLLALKIALANIAAVVLSVVFIGISGYDLDGIKRTIASATGFLEKSDFSVLSMTAAGTAFLTPGLLLLVLLAFVRIYKLHKSGQSISTAIFGLLLLSILPFCVFGFYPLYKYSMSFLPALFVLLLLGFDFVFSSKLWRTVFVAAVFLPWLIGIQIDATGTFCGPGFELNMDKTLAQSQNVKGNNPDSRVKIEKVRPVLGSGFYMPMAEGPRPLYGYMYVIFGKWKSQIEQFTNEREAAYTYLAQHPDAVYYQDRQSSMLGCDLYRHGFATKTDFVQQAGNISRTFTKGKDTITIHVVPENDKVEWISNYFEQARVPVIYRSSYTNDILKLKASDIGNVTFLGPFSAIKQ